MQGRHGTAAPAATGRPAALDAIPAERIVEADVRDDLRNGREPFSRIMAARSEVPAGGALVVRAIFEPVPLYGVLGHQGFAHYTERLADDDWTVWFYRPDPERRSDEGPGPASRRLPVQEPAAPDEPDVTVLDVRNLEPPEPMVRTLAALEQLPPGGTLVQINARVPRFLLPELEHRGFAYEVREQAPDLVRVFISRKPADAGSASTESKGTDVNAPRTLDVRPIPPREKHPRIFETFGSLGPGESFVLVNDHDPKPLRYQFEFEHKGEYGWEYLEQGPAVWRVAISRTAS